MSQVSVPISDLVSLTEEAWGASERRGGRFRGTPEERFARFFVAGPADKCWLWTGTRNIRDYGVLRVPRLDGTGRYQGFLAHRFSWEFHRGPVPSGLCVCHACDVPPCVNPAYLFVGTIRENAIDSASKGRTHAQVSPETLPRGESHGTAKFTDAKIRLVREEYAAGGVIYDDLAVKHGISKHHVTKIIQMKTRRTA